jgi:nitrogen fixation protein FixH
MSPPAKKPFELNGWHVLAMLVAFFAVVIAVNVAMAVQAYATFSGEVAAKAYEEGLAFNRTLTARAERRALGWSAKVETSAENVGWIGLKVTILDRVGAPVRGLMLSGVLARPATETGRLTPRFTETKPGVYEAGAPDRPGAWDLTLSGTDPEGHAFEAERRLVWR